MCGRCAICLLIMKKRAPNVSCPSSDNPTPASECCRPRHPTRRICPTPRGGTRPAIRGIMIALQSVSLLFSRHGHQENIRRADTGKARRSRGSHRNGSADLRPQAQVTRERYSAHSRPRHPTWRICPTPRGGTRPAIRGIVIALQSVLLLFSRHGHQENIRRADTGKARRSRGSHRGHDSFREQHLIAYPSCARGSRPRTGLAPNQVKVFITLRVMLAGMNLTRSVRSTLPTTTASTR